MGASKTKTVGGTPVGQVAQGYSSYLGNALNSQNGYAQTMQSLLSGNGAGTPQTLNFLDSLKGYQAPMVSQQPQLDIGSLLSQFAAPNAGQVNTNISLPNFNPAQAPGQINLSGVPTNTNVVQNYQNQGFSGLNMNDPNVQAIQQASQNALNNSVADLRERFTQTGGASTGTPAAYGEALLRAQAAPQLTNALANYAAQNTGLNLQNNALNLQGLQANNSANLQQAGLNTDSLLQALGLGVSQRGQDLSNIANNNQLAVQSQGQNLSALLNSMGLGVQQRGQDLSNLQSTNALNANQQQTGLSGLLQMMGLNQNAALANQSAGLQGQGLNLQLGSLLNSLAGLQQNGQLNALNNLGQGYSQNYQLSTPQAQTVQTPSGFSQVMSGLGSVAGMVAPFVMGGVNPFSFLGGSGGGASLPTFDMSRFVSATPNYATP